MEAKAADMSYARDVVSSSQPNKWGKFLFQSFKTDFLKGIFLQLFLRGKRLSWHILILWCNQDQGSHLLERFQWKHPLMNEPESMFTTWVTKLSIPGVSKIGLYCLKLWPTPASWSWELLTLELGGLQIKIIKF